MGIKKKTLTVRDDDSLIEIVRILVFAQVVIAIVTTVEALIVGTFMGSPGPGVLTRIAAALTLVLYVGLGRRSPRSRKWLVRFQVGWLIFGTIDLLLAIFLANRGLELVPVLTRFVIPYTIFRILRKPHVRAQFEGKMDVEPPLPGPENSEPEPADYWEERSHALV